MMIALYSPTNLYDNIFLANYGIININDALTRIPGVASVTVFGAGQYAMRCWVNPDKLASLNITVPEIINAIQTQNTVNPAGQIGSEPVPQGQQFTYTVRAPGRLPSAEEFGNIIVRAQPDGGILRLKDVARIELGAQTYALQGRLDGKPAALLAIYQLPGSNAVQTAAGVRKLMEEAKTRFPQGLDYVIPLDTTLAVTEGLKEIQHTLLEAIVLVILVVYIFLQGWRATLIPLLAVPVSLIGTFIVFPLLGFSINTLSLFGLVLAIGLVVDDAIVVVEAVEHHIEHGLSPKEATVKAMDEVSGPVVAIALILGRCVRSNRIHSGHHWENVSAVRGDDCSVCHLLCVQRIDIEPCTFGIVIEAEKADARPARGLLQMVQPRVWQGYRRLRECVRTLDSQGGFCVCSALSALLGSWIFWEEDSDQLPSR